MTRRESREAAMCLLYEYSFNTHKTPGEILGGAAENREAVSYTHLDVYKRQS